MACCRRFGRLPTYLIATVAFIGATLGCVFAPSSEVLVLFRALQGAGGEQRALGCKVQGRSIGQAGMLCGQRAVGTDAV
jgi:MFS family permease